MKKKRILITSPIRQSRQKLKMYLDSLNMLKIDERFEVKKFFILHNCWDELKDEFPNDCELMEYNDKTNDVYDNQTHIWHPENLSAMAIMKNQIVAYSLKNEFDFTFWVDSDLVLNPITLKHLFNILDGSGESIVSEVFWTEWNKGVGNLGSNAWDYDHYMGDQERYKKPGTYQVGGTGACILVRNNIYGYNVNYSPIQNISFSYWEDRAFCIRAAVNNHKIWLDTNYPAIHLYRDEDIKDKL